MTSFDPIIKVDPRSIWKHEALDFTPWLAEHIAQLGEAIGDIELEAVQKEADVGDFSLDILAKDLQRNAIVVVENQLSSTDHDHLGKLLTYASGYNADLIIWVSLQMREEHRQALDWLNQRTDTNTYFFGVVLEVIRIGSSNPALQFKVVASPNAWQKSNKNKSSTASSERGEKYRAYFQGFYDELREVHRFTNSNKAQPKNWCHLSSGNNLFKYGHSFAQGNRVRTEIYIDSGDPQQNQHYFDQLYDRRQQLETAFGQPLEWERLEDKRASRIAVYRAGSIDDSPDELKQIKEWGIQNLLAFREIFGKQSPQPAVVPA